MTPLFVTVIDIEEYDVQGTITRLKNYGSIKFSRVRKLTWQPIQLKLDVRSTCTLAT